MNLKVETHWPNIKWQATRFHIFQPRYVKYQNIIHNRIQTFCLNRILTISINSFSTCNWIIPLTTNNINRWQNKKHQPHSQSSLKTHFTFFSTHQESKLKLTCTESCSYIPQPHWPVAGKTHWSVLSYLTVMNRSLTVWESLASSS